ncbi:MAG: lamin tail domain-containing protein [Chloroflexota bacterium]
MITVTQIRYQAFFVLAILAVLTLPPVHTGLAEDEGKLLITEVYYDTPGVDSEEEWIEIANVGSQTLNLDGIKVGDAQFPGSREGMVRFPPDAVIAPNEAIVVAQSAAGFRSLFGQTPDYEIQGSDASVPDMLPYDTWAQGDVALNNDGDEVILLDGADIVLDAMSYGDSAEFLNPSVPNALWGQSLARIPATCDTDTAGDWQPQEAPTPGQLVLQGECTPPQPQLDVVPSIGLIQGDGDSSPRLNEVVTFEGIVTGMSEDRNTRGAIFYSLFVQDAPGSEDGDPATSDAIAVFHGPRRPPYVVGDRIRVTGQVIEYFGLTEIEDSGLRIELLDTEQPLPPAVPLQLPDEQVDAYFESLEAMRVQLPDALVVGPTFGGCGFAVTPGIVSTPIIRQTLDDAVPGIVPILHHSDVSCGAFPQVKVGDRVHGLQGPLTYHFEQFKIVHQFPEELRLTLSDLPEPPQAPRIGANEASVATFNVYDHFDAKNDTGSDAEPTPTQEEVDLKERKLAQTIAGALHCPTLLAIQEVENDDLLGSLARRLQPSCGFLYDVAHRESVDARGIDLALMADPRRVQITSVAAEQHCSPLATGLPDVELSCPAAQEPLFSRPPLEVDLRLDGETYLVIVTHFKSKREGEQETAARRLAQAGAVADRVQRRLQSDSEARIIVLGDFNDYERSAPMAALTREPPGLQNTALQIPLAQRYTYNFGGISQLLDTILVSPALAPHVVSSSILHLNTDYPAAWDDDLETGFRSSDHDIPFIILDTLMEEEPLPTVTATERRPATPGPSPTAAATLTATVAVASESEDARPDFSGAFVVLTIGILVITGALIYRGSRARN